MVMALRILYCLVVFVIFMRTHPTHCYLESRMTGMETHPKCVPPSGTLDLLPRR